MKTADEFEALNRTLAGLFFLFDNACYQYRSGFASGVRPEFGDVVLEVSQEPAAQPDS